MESRNITHILSVIEDPIPYFKHISYLLIHAHDSPQQDLTKFFAESIEFIHKARTGGGSVLVHCRVGMSRSVTLTIAYILSVTELKFPTILNAVRGARKIAYPNYGFQKQLEKFEFSSLRSTRERIQRQIGPALPNDESILLENEEIFWKQFDRKPTSFNHMDYLSVLKPKKYYDTARSSSLIRGSDSYDSSSVITSKSYTSSNSRSSSLRNRYRQPYVSKSYVTMRPYQKTHWTFY